MTPCYVIVGYNNVRIYDVAKLRQLAHDQFDCQLVLVVERASLQDWQAADLVIQADLGQDPALLQVCQALAEAAMTPIGILPFSDRGVPLGAMLAQHYLLPGAQPEAALAGLDKRRFRAMEAEVPAPDHYLPLTARAIDSLETLVATREELGGKGFIKPVAEGNSRGCMAVHAHTDCAAVWAELAPYHASGIMMEPLIETAREFSWDYVAGCRWLTEKHTTQGEYRAEYQQIVPARLTSEQARWLNQAGGFMRQLLAKEWGAYHNELFLREQGASAVESNMRPAGMHIWDLAALSFDAFDPWQRWLHWASTGQTHTTLPRQLGYSGIRMLRPRQSGTLSRQADIPQLAQALGITLHQGSYSKASGERVSTRVTDNGGFMGQIVLHHADYPTLLAQLDALADAIETGTLIACDQPVVHC
jgi:hypothetical protein